MNSRRQREKEKEKERINKLSRFSLLMNRNRGREGKKKWYLCRYCMYECEARR